jgi:hypothetical protein
MTWTNARRKALPLWIVLALLILSLALVACGSGASAGSAGNSNISTHSGQPVPTSSAGGSNSGSLQSINQQVQNAVQNIDGAQNDTSNADATATSENGAPQQP